MLNPVAMSIITNVFPDARERARAIGVWGAVVGLSMALGPIVGGALTETIGWRAIFWINVPVGVAAFVLAAVFVPESRAPRSRRPDPVGQVLVAGTLVALTYGIIEGPRRGWGSPEIIALFVVGALALAALLRYEPRRTDPLLDLRFFRSVPFTSATVTAVAAFSAFAGFLFLNTLYLQDVRGYSALQAGVCTLPMALASFVLAPVAGRIVATRGVRIPLYTAGVCMAASAVLLTRLSASTPLPLLLVAYLLFGTGFGMVNSPITNTAVSGMPRAQAGVAAATASTSRQVGQSLGVAVCGSIAGAGAGVIGTGFAAATHPAWWLVAGCGAVVVLLCAVATTRSAQRSSREVAELFADDATLADTAPVGAR
jgi:EmrB/QacA subfamily drug resistance transporter